MLSPPQINVIKSPYPHVAVHGALSCYDGLERDFPDELRFSRGIRMHGDLTYPDPEYMKLIESSSAYRDLHNWVYSDEFITTFLGMFNDEIELSLASGELLFDPRELALHPEPYEKRNLIHHRNLAKTAFLFPRLDIGIGRVGYGKVNGGHGIHTDNLTRLVSILVYIEENTSMVGGEHRLYKLDGKTPVVDKVYAPKPNLMIASLQSNRAFHDVNPITEIEGVRKGFYLAVSCSTAIWRPAKERWMQKLSRNRLKRSAIRRGIGTLKANAKKIMFSQRA